MSRSRKSDSCGCGTILFVLALVALAGGSGDKSSREKAAVSSWPTSIVRSTSRPTATLMFRFTVQPTKTRANAIRQPTMTRMQQSGAISTDTPKSVLHTAPTAATVPKLMFVAAQSVANVRATPESSARVVGQLERGTEVEVYERHGEWYRIRCPETGTAGWMHDSLIASSVPAALPMRAPAPVSTPIPAAPPQQQACCKHCTTGQPCGDSCISRSYTCRKPPGCACW